MRIGIVGLAFMLAGCGGGSSSPPPAPPANAAPSAAAGPDQTAEEAAVLTLDGSASADPEGGALRYRWTQVEGPPAVLTGEDAAIAEVRLPPVADVVDLIFELRVTDPEGASASDRLTVSATPALRPSRLEFIFPFDGEDRAYTLYTPIDYDAGAPLVVILHGGTGSMREILDSTSAQSRWLDIADREGWLIAAPNGFNEDTGGLGDEQSWNDLRADERGVISQQDDAGFINTVLDQLTAGRAYDPARLFLTGASNGGMMSMRLAIEQPERFPGIASYIASLPEEPIIDAAGPTPIMILNGDEDPLVLFEGGFVAGFRSPTRPVPDTVDYWIRINGADPAPASETVLPDTDPSDGCLITEFRHLSQADGSLSVLYYFADGGGHSIPWPDGPPRTPAADALAGPLCRDADGVDLAFDFFSSL